MANQCYNCKEGLVGLGESIGSKKVCPVCKGTGFSDAVEPLSKVNENKEMAKKISFDTEVEKADAVAAEKVAHPEPTEYQAKHLADLEAAEVVEK